ncbi:MAG: hypothetical protein AB1665_02635, partial [Candidatus Thermoplasmatota archaeon]
MKENLEMIDNLYKNKWTSFVAAHPHGNVFQTPQIMNVYQDTKNYKPVFISAISERGEIQALALGYIIKENYGPLSTFTSRCIINGGPLYRGDADVLNEVG